MPKSVFSFQSGTLLSFLTAIIKEMKSFNLDLLNERVKEDFKMSINEHLREVTCHIQYFINCHGNKKMTETALP